MTDNKLADYVLVPRVPTEAMFDAGVERHRPQNMSAARLRLIWDAMLSAAPGQPPANGEAHGVVDALPPLPPVDGYDKRVAGHYSAASMHAYARTAIAALQQKVGWQPIETAPKDGRTIILAHKTSFLGFWDISQKAWCDHRKFYRDPSRWMALPPIPATGSEGEGNV